MLRLYGDQRDSLASDTALTTAVNRIGAYIYRQRKLARMSLETLSKKSGIPLEMLQEYEDGFAVPTLDELDKIADCTYGIFEPRVLLRVS